jgi:hypothetical protein
MARRSAHHVQAATAGALLQQEDLGLELVAGDEDTPFHAVRWADRADERPWLGAGDLRLTEAPFVVPRPSADPLFDPPPSVLVFARTPQRRNVPEALRARAVTLGVTLLSLRPSVAPERIEEAALRALVAAGGDGLRHIASAQRYLLERVHLLSGASLVLLAPWGDVLARAGNVGWRPRSVADPERSASEGAGMSLREGVVRLAGRDALVLRIVAQERLRAVLVSFDASERVRPWLELTRTLLLATALQRSAEARHDSTTRSALLAEWLAGPHAAAMLEPRLVDAGVGPDLPYLVAVAEVGPRLRGGRGAHARRHERLERMREAGEEYFRTLGQGVLSETRADHCLWVFASGSPRAYGEPLLNTIRAAVAEGSPIVPDVRLGVSLPRSDLTGVADAYHQAILALQAVPSATGLAWFDELDPVYWVLRQQPVENLIALRDRMIGAVKEADAQGKLWRTLVAYLRSPSDQNALAEELHIHVNTLRYRLRRIEELIGAPLSQPETLAKLHLAHQIDAMLEREGRTAG